MFKKIIRVSLSFVLSLFLFSLCSCFDLGNYNQGYTEHDGTRQWSTDYYDYFPNVIIYKDFKATTYNMSDFYNEKTYSDDPIDSYAVLDFDSIEALVIPITKDLTIGEFNIFFEGEKNSLIETNFYVSSENLSVSNSDTSTEENKKEYVVSGVPSTFNLSVGTKFASSSVPFRTVKEKEVTSGMYLIFLFTNNIVENSEKVNFRFTNILISNVS